MDKMNKEQIAQAIVDHCEQYPNFILYETGLKNLVSQNIQFFGEEGITVLDVYEAIGNRIDNNIECLDMADIIQKEKTGKYQYEVDALESCKGCSLYKEPSSKCFGCENYFVKAKFHG